MLLNTLLKSHVAATIILATNGNNVTPREGTDVVMPHATLVDLLNRHLIVKTDPYDWEQIAKVIQLRVNIEGLKPGPGVGYKAQPSRHAGTTRRRKGVCVGAVSHEKFMKLSAIYDLPDMSSSYPCLHTFSLGVP